ncbi:PREDICTED: leucine-rich repeat-containing protein 19-like [Dufourea novaeangliae]|uniref:Immunoglobulin superfamily member 10 n=1 Tax=Dufourea novaeangliae TaxID=178035 RepID=A0A154PKE5_DUFNO|nr:PREDICTED: leucine-rich repeat-containing protein 19-like [Dufourea novaeangliae]KZC11944.1 Immunoglobulin superfamily member 10 [Dufourea novaeangliae]
MTDGSTIGLVVSLVLNVVGIIVSSAQFSEMCSSLCVCDTWYELKRASCTGRHLYSIDAGTPNSVQALDLSDNVVSSLNNFELANAGLTRLKYLNLSTNTISEVDLNAFHGLAELTVLDLSKNHLYSIPDDAFVENTNLRILKLSRNNFNAHVPKLRSPSLAELSLDSCQISHLPPDTFNGLIRVRHLDLSNNMMIQMSGAIVQTLPFLKELSLEGNPWFCNRIMNDFHVYLVHKGIEFHKVCGKNSPKKFEKIILAPVKKQPNYHRSAIANATIVKTTSIIKCNVTSHSNNKNQSTDGATMQQKRIMNSYTFLVVGFLLGVATGMIISYMWLSGKYICSQCWRRENNDRSQRLSLLSNPYLQNNIDSNTSLTGSCPGTPPPAYREVMLRPSLYHCLSRTSNLNNNSTESRGRYA